MSTHQDVIADAVVVDSAAVHALSGGAALALGHVLEHPAIALTAAELVTRLPSITEGFGVTTVPNVTRAVAGTAADEVEVASALLAYFGVLVRETIGGADALGPTMKSGAVLAETLGVAELLRTAAPVALTDNVGVSAVLSLVRGAVLADILGISEAVLGQTIAQVLQTEGVTLSDALLKFLSGDVSEGVGVAHSQSTLALASEVLTEGIGVAGAITPLLLLRVDVEDSVGIDPGEALQMLFSVTAAEGVEVRAGYVAPDGSFTAWAMNTRTAAVAEYRDFAFNSFGTVDGRAVAGNADGLFELTGDTDDGDAIVSILRGGFMQFGGTQLSRLKEAYIATRGGGDFVLRIITGLGEEYNYAVTTQTTRSAKFNMGKGQRARYFAYELTSAGQDFDLDTLEFVPIVVQRRV